MKVNHTSNATHLIRDITYPKSAELIKRIELKPTEQQRILLGIFTDNNPTQRFFDRDDTRPTPEDSMLAQVTN